jgi:hypothetical protein
MYRIEWHDFVACSADVKCSVRLIPCKSNRGMDIVERIYSQWKQQPDQGMIISEGNKYLENFPGLSYIIAVTPSLA